MFRKGKSIAKNIVTRLGLKAATQSDARDGFHSDHYLRHNARRLEHLASLGIPVAGMSVLEIGAGIGDHSHYYLDRGCSITITDARTENLAYLRKRYPNGDVRFLDLECPTALAGSPFDIVHCYGVLYHLRTPEAALSYLSQNVSRFLFLETCVSFGHCEAINLIAEPQTCLTQACSGTGCRPTRPYIYRILKNLFEYVYLPHTQPNHEEFPLDWTAPEKHNSALQRAVFLASRIPLLNDRLTPSLIDKQVRHE